MKGISQDPKIATKQTFMETQCAPLQKYFVFPELRRPSLSKFAAALSAESTHVSPQSISLTTDAYNSCKNGGQYILVTGGCGYIGSHITVELLQRNFQVVIVDNLGNSSKGVLPRIKQITGKAPDFVELDLLDKPSLEAIFRQYDIQSVIHLASLKSVSQSVAQPIRYYVNNIQTTLNLIQVMEEFNVRNMVFSSSATVYGEPERLPLTENCKLGVTNPYGRTKVHTEGILRDLYASDDRWNIVILRYFNPVGAHESGLIGEDPRGTPNNLMPYVAQVAAGKRELVNVFGDDYNTKDGTGVRDYIHVVDLALGHIAALKLMKEGTCLKAYNLGTGSGYSVLDVIREMSKASGEAIPYKIVPRRPGDVAAAYCDPSLAQKELCWKATRDLRMMCCDTWNWQRRNPDGYDKLD